MTARLCKESRPLLPLLLFGAPILAACAVLDNGTCLWLATTIYCLLCAVVGIGAMGYELMHGMHLSLLVQPVAREKFWRDKMLIQGLALMGLAAIYGWVAGSVNVSKYTLYETEGSLTIAAIAPIAAFGCGSALVLMVRHVYGAFWLLIGVALLLHVGIEALWPVSLSAWRLDAHLGGVSILALAGCWLGRRQFLDFQNYSMLHGAASVGGSMTQCMRRTGITMALLRKEWGLQWINVVVFLAAILIALPLGEYRKIQIWVMMKDLVCLLLPCFAGAVAVAEERRLGVDLWQTTLTPGRFHQWVVKLGVALAVALGIGGGVFAVADWYDPEATAQEFLKFTLGSYLFYAFTATLAGLLISTISRHFIQAGVIACVALAAVGILVGYGVEWLIGRHGFVFAERVLFRVAIPVLILFSLWQSYRNFGSKESVTVLMRRTAARAVIALGGVLLMTAAIYHRGWEIVEGEGLGPAKYSAAEVESLFSTLDKGVACDASGRLWLVHWENCDQRSNSVALPMFSSTDALNNWTNRDCLKVIPTHRRGLDFGVLKSDGTFWVYGTVKEKGQVFSRGMGQLEEEHRWKDVIWCWQLTGRTWMGIREDGSLWVLGGERIGSDSDWKQVCDTSGEGIYGLKEDGSLWEWGNVRLRHGRREYLSEPRLCMETAGLKIEQLKGSYRGLLMRLEEGRWAVMNKYGFGNWSTSKRASQPLEDRINVRVFGEDSGRPEFTGSGLRNMIFAGTDGTLTEHLYGGATAFGRHSRRITGSDWLAFKQMTGIEWLGIKKDGSVWYWTDLNERFGKDFTYEGRNVERPLIPYRFRPVRLGMLDERLMAQ